MISAVTGGGLENLLFRTGLSELLKLFTILYVFESLINKKHKQEYNFL
jgi:hypothetical protein